MSFGKIIFYETVLPILPARAESVKISKRTSVLVFTSDGVHSGVGTGVLIAPKIIITAAHNFSTANIGKSRVFIPSDRVDGFRIADVKIDKTNDIAALFLEEESKIDPCKIDSETSKKRPFQIVLKTAFNTRRLPRDGRGLSADCLNATLHKGLLNLDELTLPDRSISMFELKSKRGHTGAGIFSNETGKLLTIQFNDKPGYEVRGPGFNAFRDFAKSLGL